MRSSPFHGHRFPPDVIRQAVWLYLRLTLSIRDVEDLLAERGLDVSYETIRRWVLKFGPLFARELRRRRPRPSSIWHLDEMVVRVGVSGSGSGGRSTARARSSISMSPSRTPSTSSATCSPVQYSVSFEAKHTTVEARNGGCLKFSLCGRCPARPAQRDNAPESPSGELRPDPPDHAGPEIEGHPLRRRWGRCLQDVGLELEAVRAVREPHPDRVNVFAGRDRGRVTYERHQIPLPRALTRMTA